MDVNSTPPNHTNNSSLKPHVVTAAIGILSGLLGGLFVWWTLGAPDTAAPTGERAVIEESAAVIEVVERVSPSVVTITTSREVTSFFGVSDQTTAGTGIVLSADGLILTNKHVIPEAADVILVITADGEEYEGAIVARDPLQDLAYIQIDASGLTPAKLGDSDQVAVGERVLAIGNALGQFSNTVTIGIISGAGRPVMAGSGADAMRLEDMFQTDAAINPGNSGGPLVNIQGEVIGVNTAVARAENIGFAIPINQAKAGITSIVTGGSFQKAYLGVRYTIITHELATQEDLPITRGALVTASLGEEAVAPGSPAEQAGLRAGDIILAVEGIEINQARSLVTLIGRYLPGDRINLSVLRAGDEIEVTAELSALPADF